MTGAGEAELLAALTEPTRASTFGVAVSSAVVPADFAASSAAVPEVVTLSIVTPDTESLTLLALSLIALKVALAAATPTSLT